MSETNTPAPPPVLADRVPLESSLNFEFDRISTLGYARPAPPSFRRTAVIASVFAALFAALWLVSTGATIWQFVKAPANTSFGIGQFGPVLFLTFVLIHGGVSLLIMASACACLCGRNARRSLIAGCAVQMAVNLTSMSLSTVAMYRVLQQGAPTPAFSPEYWVFSSFSQALLMNLLPALVIILLIGKHNDQAFDRRP